MSILDPLFVSFRDIITQPFINQLKKTSLTPNNVTCIGLVMAFLAGVCIGFGFLFAGGLFTVLSGLCDMLDGAMARNMGRVTVFGAILDSTLDRFEEAVIFIGILLFYAQGRVISGTLVTGFAWLASLLVSYIRARAEGSGLQCKVGIFTRAERIIVLSLGLLLSPFYHTLIPALIIIAGLGFFTAGQRLVNVMKDADRID